MSTRNNGLIHDRRKQVRRAPITRWEDYRLHVRLGSLFGNVVFVLFGIYVGVSFGGFGGIKYFSSMYLLDRTGSLAAIFGLCAGILIGVLCVWAIFVITAAGVGALIYWLRARTIPTPPE